MWCLYPMTPSSNCWKLPHNWNFFKKYEQKKKRLFEVAAIVEAIHVFIKYMIPRVICLKCISWISLDITDMFFQSKADDLHWNENVNTISFCFITTVQHIRYFSYIMPLSTPSPHTIVRDIIEKYLHYYVYTLGTWYCNIMLKTGNIS